MRYYFHVWVLIEYVTEDQMSTLTYVRTFPYAYSTHTHVLMYTILLVIAITDHFFLHFLFKKLHREEIRQNCTIQYTKNYFVFPTIVWYFPLMIIKG